MRKTITYCIAILAILTLVALPASAKDYPPSWLPTMAVLDTLPDEGFGEPLDVSREPIDDRSPFHFEPAPSKIITETSIAVDTTYQQLVRLPKDYSGYKIEVMRTTQPLPSDHELFFQHGRLSMEKLSETNYSYTLGHFTNEGDAQLFLEDFMQQRYPTARVIGYEGGERTN